jgi:hypothetical protein
LVQAEGEVEALGVIVAASVLDGEGVAPDPLQRILLEFLWEEEVAKSHRAGGEAVVVAYGGGLLPPQFFNLLAGVETAL